MRLISFVFLSCAVLLLSAGTATCQGIEWRVANPFRLFTAKEDLTPHREAFDKWRKLSDADRNRLRTDKDIAGPIAYAEIAYFSDPDSWRGINYLVANGLLDPYRGWAEPVIKGNRTCFNAGSVEANDEAQPAAQQYSACEAGGRHNKTPGSYPEGSYVRPTHHQILVSLVGLNAEGVCSWHVTDMADRPIQGPVRADCKEEASLLIPHPLRVKILVKKADDVLAVLPQVEVKDILLVGLGDSFASGEGNPDVPIRLSSTVYNNYEEYLTTEGGDAADWCRAHARGKNAQVDQGRCGDRGTHYRLGGYPARHNVQTNYTDDLGSFFTNTEAFHEPAFMGKSSNWLSTTCHRSLYSHQIRVALQLALEDPHRAVTFLGYACTGAEIVGGLLTPETFNFQREHERKRQVRSSQLSALSKDLCRTSATATKTVKRDLVADNVLTSSLFDPSPGVAQRSFSEAREQGHTRADICENPRKVDLVLAGFGGNDIGFVPMIGYLITGHDDLAERWGKKIFHGLYDVSDSSKRLPMLTLRYRAMASALERFLKLDRREAERVLLAAYPQLAYDETGQICSGAYLDPRDTRAPRGARRIQPVSMGMNFHPLFRFDDELARSLQVYADKDAPDGLFGRMRQQASGNGWTFVAGHVKKTSRHEHAAFTRHGICARRKLAADAPLSLVLAEEMGLPRCYYGGRGVCERAMWKTRPDYGQAYDPAQFSPYTSRQRWFRTLNDAYMSDHFHPASGTVVDSRASWLLAASAAYSGAFHPSAEGQAAVADAVLLKARCVLKKYEGVSTKGLADSSLYAHCASGP